MRSAHLWGEDGEGNQRAEKTQRHPVCGKFSDPEVEDDELQLPPQRQTRVPDVGCNPPPQLYRPARPPVLLFPVRKEAGGKLCSTSTID
jgi:hypothetical protein